MFSFRVNGCSDKASTKEAPHRNCLNMIKEISFFIWIKKFLCASFLFLFKALFPDFWFSWKCVLCGVSAQILRGKSHDRNQSRIHLRIGDNLMLNRQHSGVSFHMGICAFGKHTSWQINSISFLILKNCYTTKYIRISLSLYFFVQFFLLRWKMDLFGCCWLNGV